MALSVQANYLNALKLSLWIKVAMAIYKHWIDIKIPSRHTRKRRLCIAGVLFSYHEYLYQISP